MKFLNGTDKDQLVENVLPLL